MGCKGVARPLHSDELHQLPKWHCSSCGELPSESMSAMLHEEADLRNQVEHIAPESFGGLQNIDPDKLDKLAGELAGTISVRLSPTHFLNVQLFQSLYNIYASLAVFVETLLENRPCA